MDNMQYEWNSENWDEYWIPEYMDDYEPPEDELDQEYYDPALNIDESEEP